MLKKDFKKLSQKVEVQNYSDLSGYLKALYDVAKFEKPGYNYHLFSQNLGLGNCNASLLVIRKWRKISLPKAKEMAKNLGLVKEKRRYFLQLARLNGSKTQNQDKEVLRLLDIRREDMNPGDKIYTEFFAHWYHAALLELMHQKDLDQRPENLARQLRIAVRPKMIEEGIRVLLSLKLIYWDKKAKRYLPSQLSLSTRPEVYDLSVMAFHQQMLGISEQALVQVDEAERDFGALTITLPTEKIGQLKEMLYDFREKLLDFSNQTEDGKDVVQINMQMFPLNKKNGKKKKPS